MSGTGAAPMQIASDLLLTKQSRGQATNEKGFIDINNDEDDEPISPYPDGSDGTLYLWGYSAV